MKLDKDISKVTKPELVQILRLCIGKHCDECPLANEFDRDACYRILMVRCIDEFKNDRQKMDEALKHVRNIKRGLDELITCTINIMGEQNAQDLRHGLYSGNEEEEEYEDFTERDTIKCGR